MKAKMTLLTFFTLCISSTIFAEKKLYLVNKSNREIMYQVSFERLTQATTLYPTKANLLNQDKALPKLLSMQHERDIKGNLGKLNNYLQDALTLLKNDANQDAAVAIIINSDFSLAIKKAPATSTSTTSSLPPSRPVPAIPTPSKPTRPKSPVPSTLPTPQAPNLEDDWTMVDQ